MEVDVAHNGDIEGEAVKYMEEENDGTKLEMYVSKSSFKNYYL